MVRSEIFMTMAEDVLRPLFCFLKNRMDPPSE